MDRSSIGAENQYRTLAPKDILDQMALIDIYQTFHRKVAEYTFFISEHETFFVAPKTSLNKLKKIEIISSVSSNHNSVRLAIKLKNRNCRKHKHMKSKQYTTKKPMVH